MAVRRQRQSSNRSRGFSLIELGIVLGVSAILATAVLPDVIQAARDKMAERAAADVGVIQDAARWYFIQTLNDKLPANRGVWPGESGPNSCNMAVDGIARLVSRGYLTSAPKNPWDFPYKVALVQQATLGSGGIDPGCNFEVSTEVPKAVRTSFKNIVPLGQCNDQLDAKFKCKGTPSSSDNVVCCSFINKPGLMVSPCPGGATPINAGVNMPVRCP